MDPGSWLSPVLILDEEMRFRISARNNMVDTKVSNEDHETQ